MLLPTRDRFGLGWRPELAVDILSNLDRIEVVEVIIDDLFHAPSKQLRSIQTLAKQVPVVLHGVSLGLASATAVDKRRLDQIARVVSAIEPAFWSEHLAFVRGGAVEIGHLAAPPRTMSTIEGTANNLRRAREVVGTAPWIENIATLIEPPGSALDEATWTSRILRETGNQMLLDLNNLYTNSVNFKTDAAHFLEQLPASQIGAIHLAGGKWISSRKGEKRLLDDHLHDVPEEVYALLTEVGARATQPLTVILERDGAYPKFESLLSQLDRARTALALGRSRAVAPLPTAMSKLINPRIDNKLAPALEAYLAKLYVDTDARERFLASPTAEATRAGLDRTTSEDLARFDRVGLELAAGSFAIKRLHKQ